MEVSTPTNRANATRQPMRQLVSQSSNSKMRNLNMFSDCRNQFAWCNRYTMKVLCLCLQVSCLPKSNVHLSLSHTRTPAEYRLKTSLILQRCAPRRPPLFFGWGDLKEASRLQFFSLASVDGRAGQCAECRGASCLSNLKYYILTKKTSCYRNDACSSYPPYTQYSSLELQFATSGQ